jgi:UDP-glucose 4-epimerase
VKVVVTGALGHIGSALVRDLPARFPGIEIVMIDNLLTQRFASLFDLPAGGRYRFVEGDVRKTDLAPLFSGADAVVHLAAITDAAGSFGQAAEVESNNYEGTAAVAEAAAVAGAGLIALSSTSVYGTQTGVVDEESDELKPQSPYAETKLKEENLVVALAVSGKLRAVSCRFGTIFGTSPGMRFHTAVNKFCWQAVMGLPLSVWRTAYDQKRPYLDLKDAIGAIAFILDKHLYDGRVYNVLTLNATVGNIVDAIRTFVPELAVKFVDSSIMNQLSYEVSDERFRAVGFTPGGDLHRGVGQTIALLARANERE